MKAIYVTDGFVMNGATSIPKSVLRLVLDKGLTPIWNLNCIQIWIINYSLHFINDIINIYILLIIVLLGD